MCKCNRKTPPEINKYLDTILYYYPTNNNNKKCTTN